MYRRAVELKMTIQRNEIAIKRVSDELTKEGNAMQRREGVLTHVPVIRFFSTTKFLYYSLTLLSLGTLKLALKCLGATS